MYNFKRDGITIAGVVSDKHLDLFVQTMYLSKKNRNLATAVDDQASANTSETTSGTVSKTRLPLDSLGSQEQNQERTSPLTNRELLTMARDLFPTSDFTEGEKTAFDVFTKRLDRLNDLQNQRQELGSLYKEQLFGSNVDRQAAAETLNRMHILDDQIKKASNDVLDVEEKEVLKRVLSKASLYLSRFCEVFLL